MPNDQMIESLFVIDRLFHAGIEIIGGRPLMSGRAADNNVKGFPQIVCINP